MIIKNKQLLLLTDVRMDRQILSLSFDRLIPSQEALPLSSESIANNQNP
jgi:hypothetical protein